MKNSEGLKVETVECEKCGRHTNYVKGLIDSTLQEMKEQQIEFNFGMAIHLLKEGERVTRKIWNNKGIFIYLVRGTSIPKRNLRNEAALQIADSPLETVQINSHIDMKAADGSVVIGWLASQTDMLTEDWILV